MSATLLLAALPLLFWPQGVETAPALKQAGIARVAVPPEQAAAWREAGFDVVEVKDEERRARTLLPVPGVVPQSRRVTATRAVRSPPATFWAKPTASTSGVRMLRIRYQAPNTMPTTSARIMKPAIWMLSARAAENRAWASCMILPCRLAKACRLSR